MNKIRALVIVFLAALMSTTISAKTTTKSITIPDVHEVKASNAIDVELTLGIFDPQATITAEEDIIDKIKITCNDGKITIGVDGQIKNMSKVKVCISLSTVDEVKASTASSIKVIGTVTGNEFEAEASSAGNIIVDAVNVSGKVDIEVASAGKMTAKNITASEVDIEGASSGNITIDNIVAHKCEVEAASAATVEIKGGNASECDFEASSAAKIKASKFVVQSGELESSSGAKIVSNVLSAKIKKNISGWIENK